MIEVIGVRFRPNGRIYFFAPNNIELEVGDSVIVETARGVEYGKVVLGKREVDEGSITSTLKPVLRKATTEDDRKNEANKAKWYTYEIQIANGFATCSDISKKNIDETIMMADDAMYANKNLLKRGSC